MKEQDRHHGDGAVDHDHERCHGHYAARRRLSTSDFILARTTSLTLEEFWGDRSLNRSRTIPNAPDKAMPPEIRVADRAFSSHEPYVCLCITHLQTETETTKCVRLASPTIQLLHLMLLGLARIHTFNVAAPRDAGAYAQTKCRS